MPAGGGGGWDTGSAADDRGDTGSGEPQRLSRQRGDEVEELLSLLDSRPDDPALLGRLRTLHTERVFDVMAAEPRPSNQSRLGDPFFRAGGQGVELATIGPGTIALATPAAAARPARSQAPSAAAAAAAAAAQNASSERPALPPRGPRAAGGGEKRACRPFRCFARVTVACPGGMLFIFFVMMVAAAMVGPVYGPPFAVDEGTAGFRTRGTQVSMEYNTDQLLRTVTADDYYPAPVLTARRDASTERYLPGWGQRRRQLQTPSPARRPGWYRELYTQADRSFVDSTPLLPAVDVDGLWWAGMTPASTDHSDTAPLWYSNDAAFPAAMPGLLQPDQFALRLRADLTIATDSAGTYDFRLSSDDGSLLYIDGWLVINNDGWHGRRAVDGSVELAAGDHALVVVFFEDRGGALLELSWSPTPGHTLVALEGSRVSNDVAGPSAEDIRSRQAASLSMAVQTGEAARDMSANTVCQSCSTNIDVIYKAAGSGDILTAATFRQICAWEDHLVSKLISPGGAGPIGCVKRQGQTCCPPLSLPRMLSAVLAKSCEDLTDSDISMALQLGSAFLPEAQNATLHEVLLDSGYMTAAVGRKSVHTRSLLCLDSGGNHSTRTLFKKQLLVEWNDWLENWVNEANEANEAGVELVLFNRDLRDEYMQQQLFRDLYLAGGAFLAMFIALVFHTGSICLAACGMLHILCSVPIAYGCYTVGLGFTSFPYINLIGVFVVAGIGVDDVYVFSDAWKQAETMLPPGTSLERRFEFAHQRATVAMFITSLTTAVAFVANGVSAVPPIRLFGYFMALLVVGNYILVITWFPAATVIHHKYCNKRYCCCGPAKPQRYEAQRPGRGGGAAADDDDDDGDSDGDDGGVLGGPVEEETVALQLVPPKAEPRWVERCFQDRWSHWLYRLRWPAVIFCLAAGAGAAWLVLEQLGYATKEVQVLVPGHTFSIYQEWVESFASSPHLTKNGLTIRLTFGLVPADTGDVYTDSDRGELIYDTDFDIAEPAAQQWVLQLLAHLRAGPEGLEINTDSWRCDTTTGAGGSCTDLETFGAWIAARGSRLERGRPARHACDEALAAMPAPQQLPVTRAIFVECWKEWILADDACRRAYWRWPGNLTAAVVPAAEMQPVVMAVSVPTHFIASWDYHKMSTYHQLWKHLIGQFVQHGPPSCRSAFVIHGWFSLMDLQGNLADSAVKAMGFSVLLGLIVLLLATRSVLLTALATVAIAGILACSMAVLVALGWELGILESMCLAILVGLSCDFVVHLVGALQLSSCVDSAPLYALFSL